jgi:CheY-like chemotaxis protein
MTVPAQRILLVDDDADVRDTLSRLLAVFGYEVESAHDGAAALQLLRAGLRPAVLLLDLTMPNVDGHRFRAIVGGDPDLARIPIVIVTADRRATAESLGVAALVRKPFDPGELLDVLKRHC